MSDSGDDVARAILEQAPDAIVYSDASGTIREWNVRAAELFGIPREEALGQSLDVIIPGRWREAHWRGFRAAVASGRTRNGGRAVLTRAVGAGGEQVYVEMSFSLVVDRHGAVIGAVAVARDVTGKTMDSRRAATT